MYSVMYTSVMSDPLGPHGLQSTRLLCPRDSSGKNTGVGCHSLLQGIFLTQGSNLHLFCLLHYRQILYPTSHLGSQPFIYKPKYALTKQNILHITFHTFLYFKFFLRKDLRFSEQFKTHSKTERKGQRLSPDPTHECLSPLSTSSTTVAHLLQLINPYGYLIITRSLQFTLGFIHNAVHSMSLDKCIMHVSITIMVLNRVVSLY